VARIREERDKTGEVYEELEPKVWEVIAEKPFDVEQEQYVVCLDTMGQDREFTDEQRRFALTTVRNFKDIWERTE